MKTLAMHEGWGNSSRLGQFIKAGTIHQGWGNA
jgi:hypothetical protein